MLTEATHFPPNRAGNTRKIQKEIRLLENQLASALVTLEEAQRVVDGLTKTLAERKNSVTPMYLLPNELFSSIFELCALDDWKSPLRIGCVSRHIRNIILNTPRAWCSVLVDEREEIGQLYFERSGQCGLHIGLLSLADIALPEEVINRIECMNLKYLEKDDITTAFSSLVRLCVQDMDLSPRISEITISTFPLLRHLDLSNVGSEKNLNRLFRPSETDTSSLPPLESLALYIEPYTQFWLPIIHACSASLKSLCLIFDFYPVATSPTEINLPMLNYLELKYGDIDDAELSWLSVKAPVLQVYIDFNEPECCCLLSSGLQMITHLRSNMTPSISQLKDVRTLQLRLSSPSIFLEELKTSEITLHYLETLEFSGIWGDDMNEAVRYVDKWECARYPDLKPLIVEDLWDKGPYWDPATLCDIHMPCNPHGKHL